MGLIRLLRHGAEEAGELRQFALKDRLAEIDVSQHPVARVGEARIGGGVEEGVGFRCEMGGGRNGACLLASEMVEERPTWEAGFGADVLNPRSRIAPGADDMDRGVEQPLSGGPRRRRCSCLPAAPVWSRGTGSSFI